MPPIYFVSYSLDPSTRNTPYTWVTGVYGLTIIVLIGRCNASTSMLNLIRVFFFK